MATKLTAKQQRFVDEYLIDLNATQAAIRAGYSEKTAYSIGDENLTKPVIKDAIEKALAAISSERIADTVEVMEYLTAVMRREHKENIVVTLQEETSTYAPDENGTMRKQTIKREVPQLVEIPAKLSDANKAAELLGKRYGIFTDKVKLEGAVPIVIVDDLGEEDG